MLLHCTYTILAAVTYKALFLTSLDYFNLFTFLLTFLLDFTFAPPSKPFQAAARKIIFTCEPVHEKKKNTDYDVSAECLEYNLNLTLLVK